ncbi:nucleolar protein 8 [Elgaria multicarinata webbii]|uniref:nucleolar protein 8 n=1 Tax=Elgaria multicarinata webbii TaxID=159646 RepID=UPI002FCD48E3
MSKKRQGQFPVTKKQPKKKMRVQDRDSLSRMELNSCCQFPSGATNIARAKVVRNHTPDTKKQSKERSADQKLTSCRNIKSWPENGMDSEEEEEIRAIIAREREVYKDNPNSEPEDNMEVVGDNFELKYSTHWSVRKAHGAKKVHKARNGVLKTPENESDYDSADTDEIIAVTKMPNEKENNEARKGSEAACEGLDGKPRRGILMDATSSGSSDSSGLIWDKLKRGGRAMPEKATAAKATQTPEQNSITNQCKSEGEESSDSSVDTSEPEGDEDYETMMQSCYRLNLTLEDLARLASEKAETSDEDTESIRSCTQYENHISPINSTSNPLKKSADSPPLKKCICPEEIVSAILEEESSDEDNPKKKDGKLKVQPFRGIGSLSEKLTMGEVDIHRSVDNQSSPDLAELETLKSISKPWCSDSASKRLNSKSPSLKEMNLDSHKGSHTVNADISDRGSSSTEASEVESSDGSVATKRKPSRNLKSLPKRTKAEASIKGSHLVQNENLSSPLNREEAFLDSAKATRKSDTKEKQLQDNERRLTALQERQKERELQKKLIQGALTNLEIQSTNKQTHIVFDSDGENESEIEEITKEGSSGKLAGKEFTTKTSGKLFESSEDELDTADEEDDRFKIKPQFEGKAGVKLMRLQSRFGTDERFRMDTRFLESDSEQEDESKKLEVDEEEELALEKKKNLEILKNLLHIEIEPPKPSKLTANARKFKDMNALRYDPTRQDHAVFERKPENTEKERKAKTKKKREEAQKLPEVSKEIFYNVAVDLKEVFGSTKCDEETEITPWDKHDDEEQAAPVEIEALKISPGNNRQEKTSGFTFSFFSAGEERSPMKEEPYAIETIKPSRVAWQEDPRFQDSSSEEEDEPEVVESEDVKEMSPALPHSNVRFFFFSQDDDRLKEGPKLFCKSSDLDEDRDYWESRREMLLEDCRKKHKDARRKVKVKQ